AVVAAVVAVAAAGLMWLRRLAASDGAGVALPSAIVVVLTASAWLLEAVVVWRASGWAGIDLAYHDALLVTAAAVSAQIVAVAPSGVGTYEAAAVAAFGIAGHDPAVALAAAVAAHAVKTAYSLVAGGVALAVPAPSLVGRLRLPRTTERQVAPPGDGPIVLFFPAHDEEHTVADVAARAPRNVGGRDVRVVVVDDGSTDETATRALEAGAEVVGFPENRGLGAAVRRGIEHSLAAHDPSVVVFCDADGEYAPEELGRMVEPILSGRAHYVVGSRFTGRIDRMLAHRRFGNRVLTAGLRWVARRPITDGQSGYRALHRDAAAEAWIAHDYNYAQVLTLDLVGRGFVYHEVPISYGFRTQGRSFVRLGRYLRCVIPAVHAVVNRPLGGGDIPVIDLIRTEHTMEETVR
ncbi:MAG: glycosyltransferase family 2 protein, partial [Acidimicrobiales bacterium]|nr:glycosyltransferase family 2 protein [Acidimicrobiales bacterium]